MRDRETKRDLPSSLALSEKNEFKEDHEVTSLVDRRSKNQSYESYWRYKLLVLLLHHLSNSDDGYKLYFNSDKGNSAVVYDIKIMKRLLEDDVCSRRLFCTHSTGAIPLPGFSESEKFCSAQGFEGYSVSEECERYFPYWRRAAAIEDAGCKSMVVLFSGKPGDRRSVYNAILKSLQESWFSQKLCYTWTTASDLLCNEISCAPRLPPSDAIWHGGTIVKRSTLMNGDGNCRTTA